MLISYGFYNAADELISENQKVMRNIDTSTHILHNPGFDTLFILVGPSKTIETPAIHRTFIYSAGFSTSDSTSEGVFIPSIQYFV